MVGLAKTPSVTSLYKFRFGRMSSDPMNSTFFRAAESAKKENWLKSKKKIFLSIFLLLLLSWRRQWTLSVGIKDKVKCTFRGQIKYRRKKQVNKAQ